MRWRLPSGAQAMLPTPFSSAVSAVASPPADEMQVDLALAVAVAGEGEPARIGRPLRAAGRLLAAGELVALA